MKKKLGSLALILSILAGILSGCGNTPESTAQSASEMVQASENETAAVSQQAPEVSATEASMAEASVEEETVYEKVPVEVPFADGETITCSC